MAFRSTCRVSDRVQPTVVTATNPDRLVLDFPNTTAGVKQQRISVNADGVRAVRFGLHSSEPAITRVVIDLDSAHPTNCKATEHRSV